MEKRIWLVRAIPGTRKPVPSRNKAKTMVLWATRNSKLLHGTWQIQLGFVISSFVSRGYLLSANNSVRFPLFAAGKFLAFQRHFLASNCALDSKKNKAFFTFFNILKVIIPRLTIFDESNFAILRISNILVTSLEMRWSLTEYYDESHFHRLDLRSRDQPSGRCPPGVPGRSLA